MRDLVHIMKKRIVGFTVLFFVLISIAFGITLLYINKNADKTISYNQFTTLFNEMNLKMKLPNYNNLGGNEGLQLVCIDDRMSFGHRSYLTLDNEQSNKSTQERIEYTDKEQKTFVAIDLIYLNKPLDNDLIYWCDPLINNKENEFMRNSFTENIISYKNVLIKISLFSTDAHEIDIITLTDISVNVVDFIKKAELKE